MGGYVVGCVAAVVLYDSVWLYGLFLLGIKAL